MPEKGYRLIEDREPCRLESITKCAIEYLFTWSKLKDRQLAVWSSPGRGNHSGQAAQDAIKTRVRVPLSTSNTAIAPYVHGAVHDLFELFGGTDVKVPEVEAEVLRLLRKQ